MKLRVVLQVACLFLVLIYVLKDASHVCQAFFCLCAVLTSGSAKAAKAEKLQEQAAGLGGFTFHIPVL